MAKRAKASRVDAPLEGRVCERCRFASNGAAHVTSDVLCSEHVPDEARTREVVAGLSPEERVEIEDTYPTGRGVDRVIAPRLYAKRLCRQIGDRGKFAVDVEWTPLGQAVGAVVTEGLEKP